jgi:Electron transfer flavoprotein domain
VHDRQGLFTRGATLPNLIVYIDRREGKPTSPSLFALSEARRIAHAAGLTVFALVFDEPQGGLRSDALAGTLGRAGADRVLVCEGVGLGAPPLDVTHGRALFTAAERVPPIVVLFPSGGPGEELGPPLTMRLGAAYAPSVDFQVSEEAGPLAEGVGRILLRRWRADGAGYRQIDPVEIERPVVALMGAHGVPSEDGTPDIDLEIIACAPASEAPPVIELASEPDDLDPVVQARGLVLLGRQVEGPMADRLRAAAPPGVVVVDGATSPRALAAASPEFVLDVGSTDRKGEVGLSPRARLGLLRLDAGGRPAADDGSPRRHHDVVWDPEGRDPWPDLLAALGSAH